MQIDELVDELLTTSRAFVGIAVRSIESAPVDVTVAQHRLLVLLAAHGPQNVGEIADLLGVNQSNASRHCDRLQRLGLVARRRSPDDGRIVQVQLTRDGGRLVEAVMHRRREALRTVLDRMDVADGATVVAALRAFNTAAQEVEPEDWREPVAR
jgi:DNA-binding MarR family transcriptional regulator